MKPLSIAMTSLHHTQSPFEHADMFATHRLSVITLSNIFLNVLCYRDLRFLPRSDSLLHTAAEEGCLAGSRWLLDKGVVADKADKTGQQAVHLAAKNGHQRLLRLLALHNVSLAVQDGVGHTPIYLFAKSGLPGSGRVIIRQLSGEDLSRPDREQKAWTPLHWAAYNGNLDLTMALVEGGALVNRMSSEGETPLDAAFEGTHFRLRKAKKEKADMAELEYFRDSQVQMVEYLQNHGARTNKVNPYLLSKEDVH